MGSFPSWRKETRLHSWGKGSGHQVSFLWVASSKFWGTQPSSGGVWCYSKNGKWFERPRALMLAQGTSLFYRDVPAAAHAPISAGRTMAAFPLKHRQHQSSAPQVSICLAVKFPRKTEGSPFPRCRKHNSPPLPPQHLFCAC